MVVAGVYLVAPAAAGQFGRRQSKPLPDNPAANNPQRTENL